MSYKNFDLWSLIMIILALQEESTIHGGITSTTMKSQIKELPLLSDHRNTWLDGTITWASLPSAHKTSRAQCSRYFEIFAIIIDFYMLMLACVKSVLKNFYMDCCFVQHRTVDFQFRFFEVKGYFVLRCWQADITSVECLCSSQCEPGHELSTFGFLIQDVSLGLHIIIILVDV